MQAGLEVNHADYTPISLTNDQVSNEHFESGGLGLTGYPTLLLFPVYCQLLSKERVDGESEALSLVGAGLAEVGRTIFRPNRPHHDTPPPLALPGSPKLA